MQKKPVNISFLLETKTDNLTNSKINKSKILYSSNNKTEETDLKLLAGLNTKNSQSFNLNSANNLSSSLLKKSYFSSGLPLGKKLKILQNLEDIDDKIKFGCINVVPKNSLLKVNENKFLNYKDIEKEVKKREKEVKSNLQKATDKNSRNLTSFQKNELNKVILKEKIQFKKDIYHNQENLLKNIIDEDNDLLKQSILII